MARIPEQIVWKGVLVEESSWCVALQGSYKMKLREMYKDYYDQKDLIPKENLIEFKFEDFKSDSMKYLLKIHKKFKNKY